MFLRHRATLIVILVLCSLSPCWAGSDKIYADTATIERIRSVYDGDTFRCDLAGYPAIVGENIGIRVNGIDTPEMKDKRPTVKALARLARDYVRQAFASAQIIELGYAHPYDGGRKQKW